jgi:hypothetical protein
MKINKKQVIDLYNQNLSQKEIALIIGASQVRVSEIIRSYGLTRDKSVLNLNRVNINIKYFQKIDNSQKAYWLGYICADGSINKNNNKMTLTSKDLEIIEKFKNDIESGHAISKSEYFDKRTNKNYTRYTIQITTKPFVSYLINHGVTNKKTDYLLFPTIDEKYYSYFIAGLFDGDGSLYIKSERNITVNLISTKEMLLFIQNYIYEKLNIKPKNLLKVTNNKINVYKMYLRKGSNDFLNFIYNDNNIDTNIYLQRKYNKLKIYKEKNEKRRNEKNIVH